MTPQTILITGATGAIGSALALAYAAPGRTLVLHGRNSERLQAIARACEGLGARVESRALDVRDSVVLTAWLEDVASRLGVDLVIVNAGVINVLRPGEAREDREDAARVMDVREDAPAARGGLRAGDVILALAGESVEDSPTFAAALANKSGPTELLILRDGKPHKIVVELKVQ